MNPSVRFLFTACVASVIAAAPQAAAAAAAAAKESVKQTAYPEHAYFGDTHVHTGWSGDAGTDGTITSPEDAFRFARGDAIKSNSGQTAKMLRPLDWMVISDHSDGMGTINEVRDANPDMIKDDPFMKEWSAVLKSEDEKARLEFLLKVVDRQVAGTLPKSFTDPRWIKSAWDKTCDIAEKYNDPGRFTAFIGYEWTSNADDGNNLHRNVIYRGGAENAKKMIPLTTFTSRDPATLWKWMAQFEAKTGDRLLAIPHNGNLSNGRMFELQQFNGKPMTPAYAAERQKWERLFEVTQIKGQSESHPSLSPNDEFSNWDMWDRSNLNGVPKQPGMVKTEYWRQALKDGLLLENTLGYNPFKLGANGGSDTHTGFSGMEEDNYWGKFKAIEPGPKRMYGGFNKTYVAFETEAAGFMGVWSTANTREALWDAMHRRETFATTGSRMTVRFFGGFDFDSSDLDSLVASGYKKGVPMGGDLKAAPAGKAPTFLVAAMKDPTGANLDRTQVVKGWVDANGETHEQIYNVSWSGNRKVGANGELAAVGNTVDLETATYTNTIGAPQLIGLWKDPSFDAKQRAVYYVRVLEIPTPRWTAYDQVRFKVKAPKGAELIHQERAFTSPIWYSPR